MRHNQRQSDFQLVKERIIQNLHITKDLKMLLQSP